MHLRYCLSAFTVTARRRRPAWVAGEPAARTAKEGADDCIQRDGWQNGIRCVVHAGCNSGWCLPDGDRARVAGPASPKHAGSARPFPSRRADSEVAPSPESRVAARNLSLARCRAFESTHLVRQAAGQDRAHYRACLEYIVEFSSQTVAPRLELVARKRKARRLATQRRSIMASASRDFDSSGGRGALLVAATKGDGIAFHPGGSRADSRSERECSGE